MANNNTSVDYNRNIAKLIAAYIEGNISVSQVAELDAWLNKSPVNREMFRYFTHPAFRTQVQQHRWN